MMFNYDIRELKSGARVALAANAKICSESVSLQQTEYRLTYLITIEMSLTH